MYEDLAVARLIVLSLKCYLDWLWSRSARSEEEWETYQAHSNYLQSLESASEDPSTALEHFRDIADNFGEINEPILQQQMVEAVSSVSPPCKTFAELYQRISRGLLANSLFEIANTLAITPESVAVEASAAYNISEQLRSKQDIEWELLEAVQDLCSWLELFLEAESLVEDTEDENEEENIDFDDGYSEELEDPFGLFAGLTFRETGLEYDLSAAHEADEPSLVSIDLDELEKLAVFLEEDLNRVLNSISPESAE